jgi:hypothetical protein
LGNIFGASGVHWEIFLTKNLVALVAMDFSDPKLNAFSALYWTRRMVSILICNQTVTGNLQSRSQSYDF